MEPKSESSTYYFECYGGAQDGYRHILPDEIIDAGIDHTLLGDCLYKITDDLIAPNVYKAVFIRVIDHGE